MHYNTYNTHSNTHTHNTHTHTRTHTQMDKDQIPALNSILERLPSLELRGLVVGAVVCHNGVQIIAEVDHRLSVATHPNTSLL